ncbi:AzlC Predicted branched-chain amino acid permease (azaleucine resistance) [Rhabdaerophilaceae bacterium]
MTTPASPNPSQPSPWPAVRAGIRDAAGLPALMLMASLIGVGGLARDVGYPMGAGVLSTVMIWAAPGQMVLFGGLAAGAALPAIAIAVSLSSIRFLPMTMSVLPLLRSERTPVWLLMLLSHYVAITAWVHAIRVLPDMPRESRIPYFLGFANTVLFAASLATGLGYYLISALAGPFAAGLLMTSPLFFLVSMVGSARQLVDWLALIFGFALAPAAIALVPAGLDLLVEGLVGGTAAYLIHRIVRARRAGSVR